MYTDFRPNSDEYAEYYQTYIGQVPDGPILPRLESQLDDLRQDLEGVDESAARFRYQQGKWSAKQVVGHMSDVETVFAYRALAITRADEQPIPGMDQDAWMAASGFNHQTWQQLLDDLIARRRATLAIFQGFGDVHWRRSGVASGFSFSVRSIAWILAGPLIHHQTILRERYRIGA